MRQNSKRNSSPVSCAGKKILCAGNFKRMRTGLETDGQGKKSDGQGITINMKAENFSTTFTYDSKGRLSTRTHPSGIVETNNYNTHGYLASISAGGATRYTITAMNARQQITAATFDSKPGFPPIFVGAGGGLYNMNGRLYDPVVGRFLSADNYVQAPGFSQSYNRYSYALNNPLKYIDPDGELGFLATLAIAWAGNYVIGWLDNVINKKMSPKDAFKNTNFIAGVNFSPADMSKQNNYGFSNPQVEAQNQVKNDKETSGKVNKKLDEVRQAHGQAWYSSSGGNGMGLPSINGTTAPWNNEVIIEKYNQILKYIDGTNQTAGYAVALTGLAVEDIKFLESTGKTTFFAGIGIAALRTDWSKTQSVVEFGIGGGLSTWGYLYPWAIPFAGVYSAVAIDKNYSKSLPERATSGYKSSNQQIRNHPYFKNLDW